MKFIKTYNGWFVPETNALVRFGEIAISQSNFLYNLKKECFKTLKSLEETFGDSSDEIKQYKKENLVFSESWESVEYFLSILDEYASQPHSIDATERIDLYLKNIFETAPPLQTSMQLYEGKWCTVYDIMLDDYESPYLIKNGLMAQEWLMLLDIIEIRNAQHHISFCKHCHDLFIKTRKNNYFCEKCTENYKSNYDKHRSNTSKGKIDKVCNYMRNSLKYSNDEIIDFRELANRKINILNTIEFDSWCEEMHRNFKKEAKNRHKI